MKFSKNMRASIGLLASVIAVPLLLMFMPARLTAPFRVVFTEALGPLQQVAYEATGDALAATGTLSDMFFAQQRDRLLRKEVLRLQNELAASEEKLKVQRTHIESAQGLVLKEVAFTAISASVTAYDSSPMRQGITVRAGTSDGVGKGMAVCAQGALVGVIEEVGPWRSRARLITDAASAVACRVSRTRGICILQGTGVDSLSVEWLDRHSEVRPGDVIVAACLGEMGQPPCMIPDGLPAAAVVSVGQNATELHFLAVTAQPRVNVSRLEAVQVLVPALTLEGR